MASQFVLLRHECPPGYPKPSHWDFMLEADGVLLTWELRELPGTWLAAFELTASSEVTTVTATQLADHRLHYLEYEGPISDGRGNVTRVDRGTYEIVQRSETRLRVNLKGSRLTGTVELEETLGSWILRVG